MKIDNKKVKEICDEEFSKLLKELKKIDRGFDILPEEENYRLGCLEKGVYANVVIIKFGCSVMIYPKEIENNHTVKQFKNLWKAKKQQMFLSLADMFSDLAEKLS